MPETLPPIASLAEHRARRRPAPRASEAEVLALVARASQLADGLAVLEGAPLECAAVLLGVDPRTVERVRAALEDPARRAEAARHHQRLAAGRRPARPARGAEEAAPPRDAQSLLLAALSREDGVDLLLSAAPEAAAVVFGVHPELVHRVREAGGARPGRVRE